MDEHAAQFEIYRSLLLEWNQRVNLTAITDPKEIEAKHFADSLAILQCVDIPQSARFIDIGTGAGFPGVPLKIVRPDLRLTLLDSLGKRIRFLEALLHELGIEAELVQMRAEEGGRNLELRENFDFAAARAVAPLRILAEYCLPYVRPGGIFIAMKGSAGEQEAQDAKEALSLLGGRLKEIVKLEVAHGVPRQILIIEKTGTTNLKYPRRQAQIMKSPL